MQSKGCRKMKGRPGPLGLFSLTCLGWTQNSGGRRPRLAYLQSQCRAWRSLGWGYLWVFTWCVLQVKLRWEGTLCLLSTYSKRDRETATWEWGFESEGVMSPKLHHGLTNGFEDVLGGGGVLTGEPMRVKLQRVGVGVARNRQVQGRLPPSRTSDTTTSAHPHLNPSSCRAHGGLEVPFSMRRPRSLPFML